MSESLNIRPATVADAAAVNAIYNPRVTGSTATFETEPYSTEARAAVIAARAGDPKQPFLVATDEASQEDDCLAGFAFAAPYDPRPGYSASVKTSGFVAEGRRGGGVADGRFIACCCHGLRLRACTAPMR